LTFDPKAIVKPYRIKEKYNLLFSFQLLFKVVCNKAYALGQK